MNQFSYYHDGSRCYRGSAIRNFLRVGLRDSYVFVAHSQCLCGNLAEHRFCALAKFGTRHQDAYGAVGAGLEADKRIQITFAGACEARAMKKSRDADSFLFVPG